MARVYVAGPLFTPQDRDVLDTIAKTIDNLEHRAILPHNEVPLEPVADAGGATDRAATLLDLVESCDAVVALLDGIDADAGTCVELGYAHALNRPILGLRSDIRRGGEADGVNLMAAGVATERATVDAWDDDTLRPIVERFLGSVRVFAGRLVRDGVPRLAKERGHPIRFERVAEDRLAPVLKRRAVEVARRLESAEFGVEQEELADLLEVLEALIASRGYDKESLRAIKEGAWRKRGGYEKGYVVEEEPQLTEPAPQAKVPQGRNENA